MAGSEYNATETTINEHHFVEDFKKKNNGFCHNSYFSSIYPFMLKSSNQEVAAVNNCMDQIQKAIDFRNFYCPLENISSACVPAENVSSYLSYNSRFFSPIYAFHNAYTSLLQSRLSFDYRPNLIENQLKINQLENAFEKSLPANYGSPGMLFFIFYCMAFNEAALFESTAKIAIPNVFL